MNTIEIPLLIFCYFILIWLAITYKFGDWRNWRVYYPTILFFWCGNLIAFEMFHSNLLWQYKSNIISHSFADLIQMLTIFSCTTIIFLQYYPKKLTNQIGYILVWVVTYSLIEWIFNMMGSIVYNRGWSIWWSIAHNIYQFALLRIHRENPLVAWTLSFIILFIMMNIFKVSLLNH